MIPPAWKQWAELPSAHNQALWGRGPKLSQPHGCHHCHAGESGWTQWRRPIRPAPECTSGPGLLPFWKVPVFPEVRGGHLAGLALWLEEPPPWGRARSQSPGDGRRRAGRVGGLLPACGVRTCWCRPRRSVRPPCCGSSPCSAPSRCLLKRGRGRLGLKSELSMPTGASTMEALVTGPVGQRREDPPVPGPPPQTWPEGVSPQNQAWRPRPHASTCPKGLAGV